MNKSSSKNEKLQWELKVSIFKNPLILKQLGLVIGIPFGILIMTLILMSDGDRYLYYALTYIGAIFLLSYIFIMIIWGGKYDVGFVIDDIGVRCYTQKSQAKKNRIINTLAVILGILTKRFVVSGAGMMAQSRQDVIIKWKNIRKIKYNQGKNLIIIKGGFAENIAVFCTRENYKEVQSFIKAKEN